MDDKIVALDIGSSTVRAVIAEYDANNKIQIVGIGQSPCSAMRFGAISNIESAIKSIQDAIIKAEVMSACDVVSVVAGIGGSQVDSCNSKGIVAIRGNSKKTDKNSSVPQEVSKTDIDNVIDSATALSMSPDKVRLCSIPRSFNVDDEKGIRDPYKHLGVRLETEVHVVNVNLTAKNSLCSAISRARYKVKNIASNILAASDAILTDEDAERGSLLIDLGADSTDAVVVIDGTPDYMTSNQFAGNFVTNEISRQLHISIDVAEKLKLKYGCCYPNSIDQNEKILIPGVGNNAPKEFSRLDFCGIIYPCVAQTLRLVYDSILKESNVNRLEGNIVLTGGGANLEGIVDLTKDIFHTESVRIGIPSYYGETRDVKAAAYRVPEFATVIGLLETSKQGIKEAEFVSEPRFREVGVFDKIFDWLKAFIREFF